MTLNLVVIAGLSGLVGMFVEQAIQKLNELANATFGSRSEKKADENTNSSSDEE